MLFVPPSIPFMAPEAEAQSDPPPTLTGGPHISTVRFRRNWQNSYAIPE